MLACAVISLAALVVTGTGVVAFAAFPISLALSGTIFTVSSLIGVIIMPHIVVKSENELESKKFDTRILQREANESTFDLGFASKRKSAQKKLNRIEILTKPTDEQLAHLKSLGSKEALNKDIDDLYANHIHRDRFIDSHSTEFLENFLKYLELREIKEFFDSKPEIEEINKGDIAYELSGSDIAFDLYEDEFNRIPGVNEGNKKELKELFYLRLSCTNLVLMIDSLAEPNADATEDYRKRYALLKSYKESAIGKFFEKEDEMVVLNESLVKRQMLNLSETLKTKEYKIFIPTFVWAKGGHSKFLDISNKSITFANARLYSTEI
jgi:hypothetical protein